MRQLRIAIVSHTALPTVGGAEVGVHEIARRLGRRHEVTVVAPRQRHAAMLPVDPGYIDDNYRSLQPPVRRNRLRRAAERVADRLGMTEAIMIVRLHRGRRGTQGLDVVNCHFLKRNLLTIICARYLLKVPVVVSLVGHPDVLAAQGRWRRRYMKWLLTLSDAVVPNSPFYLRGASIAQRATIIPYGVDLESFSATSSRSKWRRQLAYPRDAYVVLAVQRLVPHKRVDFLLRLVPLVAAGVPETRFLVVGTGPELERLKQVAHELGIAELVTFTGYVAVSDLPDVYRSADVFVTHSEFETFGVTLVEAMAAGLPVIAGDTSCMRDVLEPESAVIVPAYDNQKFADEVIRLGRDHAARGQLAIVARARAEKEFSWDGIAKRYESLFEELVSDSAGSGEPTGAGLPAKVR
jgi:glycosyltransferase involved in cell wall biosynthesis